MSKGDASAGRHKGVMGNTSWVIENLSSHQLLSDKKCRAGWLTNARQLKNTEFPQGLGGQYPISPRTAGR